jgi:hypothetical protein
MHQGTSQVRFSFAAFALWAGLSAARAEPVCDAPTEEGYRVVLSMEITGVTDGEPYQSGPDWIVERTTTVLPLCSYFTRSAATVCAPIRSTPKRRPNA